MLALPPIIPQPLPVRPAHMLESEPVPYLQPVVAFVNERLDALRCFLNGGVEVHATAFSGSTSRFSMLTVATVL